MIYLISSCTNAKKLVPNQVHLFRNYVNDKNFIFQWKENLKDKKYEKMKAKDLYKGVSWKATLDSEKRFNEKYHTKLLVASAGYGLIDSNDFISSYNITFAKNQLDSLPKNYNSNYWWNHINTFQLSQFQNNTSIFICVSKEYLKAMSSFLEDLIELYGNKVFILNTFNDKSSQFKKNILYFDIRFNQYEVGTLVSLLQRSMRWLSKEIIINNLELTHETLQNHINTLLNQYEYQTIKKGKQLTDEELKNIIVIQMKDNNINSASLGLKTLRENNYSCEQKRFHKIFNEIKEDLKNEK